MKQYSQMAGDQSEIEARLCVVDYTRYLCLYGRTSKFIESFDTWIFEVLIRMLAIMFMFSY